jgi:DNA-binding protein H-NS
MDRLEQRLETLSVEVLLTLREKLEEQLRARRAQIASELGNLEKLTGARQRVRATLKGRKVAPKYRGPNGETWAGRGAVPRWLRTLAKNEKARRQYLIERRAK